MSRLIFALAALALSAGATSSHDIYAGLKDPVTGSGCCFGYGMHVDCKSVPKDMMDAGVITETPQGYHVRLTLEQAKQFNDRTTEPVDEDVPMPRVQPGPAEGFALCLHDNHVQCFFTASNT